MIKQVSKAYPSVLALCGLLIISGPFATAAAPCSKDDDIIEPVRALTALMATCAAATIFEETQPELGLYNDGSCLLGTQLAEGESRMIHLSFRAGVTYMFVGFGDGGARDVDIHILDKNGVRVAGDIKTDSTPVVTWTPSRSGTYAVELQLFQAALWEQTSFCSLFILQEGGWHVPLRNCEAALKDLASVAGYVNRKDPGRLRMSKGNCWSVNATVLQSGDCATTRDVQLEQGTHYLVGAGDSFAIDLDNCVRATSGSLLAEDSMDDKYPISKFVGGDIPFDTRITLHRSSGPSIVLQAMLTSD